MKALIIEDTPLIARALRRGLNPQYTVDLALTGSDGIARCEKTKYDIVLLDLNLPDMPGLSVCRILRQQGVTVPILVLTGSARLEDKVTLLDSGADDYIAKPYSLEEVKARMRAALRRSVSALMTDTVLQAGDLLLDPGARTVTRGGKPVTLRRKEFDILEYLLRNEGKTVTRAMIHQHIWENGDHMWANVVDVHIKHLRDRVDRPFDVPLIKTVHGVGYKLEAAEASGSVASETKGEGAV